jgi:hypothetical protein
MAVFEYEKQLSYQRKEWSELETEKEMIERTEFRMMLDKKKPFTVGVLAYSKNTLFENTLSDSIVTTHLVKSEVS